MTNWTIRRTHLSHDVISGNDKLHVLKLINHYYCIETYCTSFSNERKNLCSYHEIHMLFEHGLNLTQLKMGPDALAVCRAHRGLPVGFLLLRFSVLFTVESLSLLYLLVIS